MDYEKSTNTYILEIRDVQETDGAMYQALKHSIILENLGPVFRLKQTYISASNRYHKVIQPLRELVLSHKLYAT